MNALQDHALADTRHGERYVTARTAPQAARDARPRPAITGARRRLGVLLVEAGLHLMTRSEAAAPLSSPLAR